MGPLIPFLASLIVSVSATRRAPVPSQRFGDAGESGDDELRNLWIAMSSGKPGQPPPSAGVGTSRSSLFRPLPYPDDELEPDVGAMTMRLHHDDLARRYAEEASAALAEWDDGAMGPGRTGGGTRTAGLQERIAWNVSGAILHDLFFASLSKRGSRESGSLGSRVALDFGSMEELEAALTDAAMSVRGDGWAVLAWEPVTGRLLTFPIGNHQEGWVPGTTPLLVIDVWEHAYYGDRGPDRAAYLRDLWKHVDWATVSRRYEDQKVTRRSPS